MTPGTGTAALSTRGNWPDAKLVDGCLRGEEWAWSALIAKYKNLIYSIPVRRHFSQEDSAEIFQSVCSKLLLELPRLRDHQALAGWLIRVTQNQCIQQQREANRYVPDDGSEQAIRAEEVPDKVFEQLEREQQIREALMGISDRCRELVHHLFFEMPVRPYKEIAAEMGFSVGSIGFTRRKCLDRLKQQLEALGRSDL